MDKVCHKCGKSPPDTKLFVIIAKNKRTLCECFECALSELCKDSAVGGE